MARRKRPEEPPNPLLRKAKIALAIVVPLLIAASLLYSSSTVHEICAVCYSGRSTSVSGFAGTPFAPRWETGRRRDERPSAACGAFFDGACPHRWRKFSARASVFFLVSMDGGTLPPQPLASQYEINDRFRRMVDKRVESGTLAKEDFRAALTVPAAPEPADLADPARRRLVVLGAGLLQESGERNSGRTWDKALADSETDAAKR
jgi:hypothetical protein